MHIDVPPEMPVADLAHHANLGLCTERDEFALTEVARLSTFTPVLGQKVQPCH